MSNVRLDIDGPVAVITNDRPDKHNAFDDDMDLALFEILGELRGRVDVRAVIWRGTGKSFSSGRDVSAIGVNQTSMTHHELMTRGHRGIQQLFDLDAPVIVACHGWTLGGSFQRALLCDIRIAATGTRFMLPEVGHGVIPDTGGVARLFQICGPGLVSDLVLTGRVLEAEEALAHGIVSRGRPRGARRHRPGDGRADRRRPGGDRQAGPARHRPHVGAPGAGLDGGRADRPDLRQPIRRLRRVPRRQGRRPPAPLHRELSRGVS